jgi:hypothetical protein
MPVSQLAKDDIAAEQLRDAIDLFMQGHYISATTLAGAAEEILGKLLGAKDIPSALDRRLVRSLDSHRALYRRLAEMPKIFDTPRLREMFDPKKVDEKTLRKRTSKWHNRARNSYKHFDTKNEPDTISVDLMEAAQRLIHRAVENCEKLYPYPNPLRSRRPRWPADEAVAKYRQWWEHSSPRAWNLSDP